MKLFVFGDSFAADSNGWPGMLDCEIINMAKNGIGEYKIFKKAMSSEENTRKLICHTSPWRIHTRIHPIHRFDSARNENDFMLNDVEYHSKNNKEMKTVHDYIKKYYDPDYQLDIYDLFVEKLSLIANSIHVTFHNPDDTSKIKNNFFTLWKENPGNINHMSLEGNKLVAEQIRKLL